ncbi:MAG: hypothetical protein CMP18_02850 [Rickettsiales bacterium]|nr:hypothetical protein [Rickettsiales bacterium]
MNKEEFIQIINSNKHLENIVTNDITMDVINKILNECDSDQLIECSQDYENKKISILGAILIYMINNQDQKLLSQELVNLFRNIELLNSTAITLCDGRTLTLLGIAIENDRTDIVEMMLENCKDPDLLNNAFKTSNNESETPFGLAIALNNTKIVEMMLKKYQSQDLLNKKARILSDGGSITPLGLAIVRGGTEIVKMILKDYPEQDLLNKKAYIYDNKKTITPFGLALTCGRADIVNMLLKDYPEQDLPNKAAHTYDERESLTPLDYLLLEVPDAEFNHEILDLVVKFTAHQEELNDPYSRLKQEHKNNIKKNNHTLNFLYNTNDSRDLDINNLNKEYLKILFKKHGVPPHFPRENQEDEDFYKSIITDPNEKLYNKIGVHIGPILEQSGNATSPAPYHLLSHYLGVHIEAILEQSGNSTSPATYHPLSRYHFLTQSTTDIKITDTDTNNALEFYHKNPQYIPQNLFNPDKQSEKVRQDYLDIISSIREEIAQIDYLDIISSIREEIAQIITLSQKLILPKCQHEIRNKMIVNYQEIISQDHELPAIHTDVPANDPGDTSSEERLEGPSSTEGERHEVVIEISNVNNGQVTTHNDPLRNPEINSPTQPQINSPPEPEINSPPEPESSGQREGYGRLLDTLIRYLGGPLLTTLSRYIFLYITIQSLETVEKYCSLLSNHKELLDLDLEANCPPRNCDDYKEICGRDIDIDSIVPGLDEALREFCDLEKVKGLGNYLTPIYYCIGLTALADFISQCFFNMHEYLTEQNFPHSRARSCADLLVIPLINILITLALTFNKDKNIHINYLNEQQNIKDDNISEEIRCKINSIAENNENDLEILHNSFSASGIEFGAILFLSVAIMLMQLCLNREIDTTEPGLESDDAGSNQDFPRTAFSARTSATNLSTRGPLQIQSN